MVRKHFWEKKGGNINIRKIKKLLKIEKRRSQK